MLAGLSATLDLLHKNHKPSILLNPLSLCVSLDQYHDYYNSKNFYTYFIPLQPDNMLIMSLSLNLFLTDQTVVQCNDVLMPPAISYCLLSKYWIKSFTVRELLCKLLKFSSGFEICRHETLKPHFMSMEIVDNDGLFSRRSSVST